jgi:anti-anti-sigma regulatory factor
MADEEKGPFSHEVGILRVNRELDEVSAEQLEEAVDRLVSSDAAAPVLDLAGISFVPSYHVEGIRSAADKCLHKGRSLTVRAKGNVSVMLERMGLGAVARLANVDRPSGATRRVTDRRTRGQRKPGDKPEP